jgi:hypothetical protein
MLESVPMNYSWKRLSHLVTSDLESDLIGGLLGCDLDKIIKTPNKNDTFLDLVFTNVPVSTWLLELLKR